MTHPWGPAAPCWEWPSLAAVAADLRDDYDERAAIGEHEREMTRERSEAEAYRLVLERAGKIAARTP